MDKPSTIDEYIAAQPKEVQPILAAVRATLRGVLPDASERLSWGMPTFWQGENIVHFAAFKYHMGFFPGGEAVSAFSERLAGYRTSKGTVQFPYDRPIEHGLIADIARWRLQQALGGKSAYAEPAARERQEMPDFVADALAREHLMDRYDARPPYQRNDYIAWIARGAKEETRQRRLDQMIAELRGGDAYMGMAYRARREDER